MKEPEQFLRDMRGMIQMAPDGQIAHSLRPKMEKLDDVPKAIQILELLDDCVYYALASEFGMMVLNKMLEAAINLENTTYAEVVSKATWRNEPRR